MYTIDSSVFVNAADTREAGYGVSRAFLGRLRTDMAPLVLPTLVLAEVGAALARTRGDTALARAVVTELRRLPRTSFVALGITVARHAAELAVIHRLRGADAVYAAVAARAETTLVSLDNEHLTRLVAFIPVITPAQALAALDQAT